MTQLSYHEYQALVRSEGMEGIRRRDPDHPWFAGGRLPSTPADWGGRVAVPKAVPDLSRFPEVPTLDQWQYITTARLVDDARRLLTQLPPDIDLIAAIPRSGLIPGSILSYHLHLPLVTVSRQKGVVSPGHGGRMEGRLALPPRHILLIDDTAASGHEMTANVPTVAAAYPDAKIMRAVVYAHPKGLPAIDLCVAVYPGQHYLEWNWPNAGHGAGCVYDFDGILCRDFTHDECRDDPTYRRTMERIEPLFLPRRAPIPLIVTARPESCRDLTLAWLARHGVKANAIIMRDWEIEPGRDWNTQVGEWKAWVYDRSPLQLFAESDPDQARIIADRTGKAVLCPSLDRVIPPKPPLERVANCPHRGSILPHTLQPECGCAELTECQAGRGLVPGRVTLRDCVGCVESRPTPTVPGIFPSDPTLTAAADGLQSHRMNSPSIV